MHNEKIPVLLIIFNRLDTTKKVFSEIRKYKPRKLFIAADGPRDQKEAVLCRTVREYILENIDWPCEYKTLFRQNNIGVKIAVSAAIDWFFDYNEMGIILEDDCVPSTSFFAFCEENLEKYKNNRNIMHISGNFFQTTKTSSHDDDYYFSTIPHIWGWASWRRAWAKYDINMKSYKEFLNQKTLNNIFHDKKSQIIWKHLFDQVYLDHSQTWDFQWAYTLFYHGGLSINPNKNIVSNIGFSKEAENCKNENDKLANIKIDNLEFPLRHPNQIIRDEAADTLTTYTHFNISLFKYFFMKINLFNTLQPFYKHFKNLKSIKI